VRKNEKWIKPEVSVLCEIFTVIDRTVQHLIMANAEKRDVIWQKDM